MTHRLEDPEVKDLDFMHNDQQQLPGQFIASVGGDGKCTVWQLPATVNGQAGVQQLTQLELPKSELLGGLLCAHCLMCTQQRQHELSCTSVSVLFWMQCLLLRQVVALGVSGATQAACRFAQALTRSYAV